MRGQQQSLWSAEEPLCNKKKDPLCTFHIPKMIYVAHIYSSPINLCFAIVANQVNQIISEQFEDHSQSTFSLKPTRWGILLKIIISTLFELRISGHLEHEYVDQTRCVNLRTAVMRGRRSVKAPDNVPSADVFWHAGNHPDQPPIDSDENLKESEIVFLTWCGIHFQIQYSRSISLKNFKLKHPQLVFQPPA